jgi:hypothetical protein
MGKGRERVRCQDRVIVSEAVADGPLRNGGTDAGMKSYVNRQMTW